MKKTVLILAMLLCSIVFSASVLAENDGVAATSSGKTVKIAGGTPGGADWGYPAPFTFYPRGPGYSRMSLLFDTLTWKDANGVIPALADGWEVSDDGKEWTFYLDRNARWHDGELFTADDVKFTIEYMQDHEGEFTWFESINYIDNVNVIDDYTVVMDLNAPMASFLVDIAGNMERCIGPTHIQNR
jgi:peptide/nickel transport system substrate-binding protein